VERGEKPKVTRMLRLEYMDRGTTEMPDRDGVGRIRRHYLWACPNRGRRGKDRAAGDQEGRGK